MTLVSLIALALSFFMAMVASWTLLLPFFDGDNAEAKADNQTVDLKLKKESLLDALEDLEQDHTSGKVSSEDYQSSKAELTAEAALVALLHRLADDVTLRQGLSRAGLLHVQQFSWQRTAQETFALYRHVLNTHQL